MPNIIYYIKKEKSWQRNYETNASKQRESSKS